MTAQFQCCACGSFSSTNGKYIRDQNGDWWCSSCFNGQIKTPPPKAYRTMCCVVIMQQQVVASRPRPKPVLCRTCGAPLGPNAQQGDECGACQLAAIKAATAAQVAAQKQARYNQAFNIPNNPYPPRGGTQTVPPTSGIKCQIKWDSDVDAYIVSTPYSPQFVEFIKLAIPVSDRAWHPETKVWYIKEKYFTVIRDIALKVYPGQVTVIERKDAEARKAASAPVAKAKLEDVLKDFVLLLPNDALRKAFLVAANELHPDKNGGDGTKMSRLNELWTRIKQDKAII